tara:strand:+ start:96 stop:1145 length:1050 start_codon:yes stop_codon:yes gene_type:complete
MISVDKSGKDTEVYKNYLRILPFFKDLVYENKASISEYWAEEVSGFEYIFDSSHLIINKLRHHCYHLTGEFPYPYRSHHKFRSKQFFEKLKLLESTSLVVDKNLDLLVSEPEILGGFGFKIENKYVNKDTLKFYECMIALQKSNLIDANNNNKESVICEIGGGWGGFAHCFCTIFPNTKYVIVDLPNTLIFSYLFLSELFPTKKVKLFNYEAESTEECDFLLIPNTEFDKYEGSIDGAINICSFQEMTSTQVSDYVNKLHDMGSKFIYSLNRNLNKNNLSLKNTINDHISEKFIVEKIDILNIPYTELNVNQMKTSKINFIKNILKLITGKKKNKFTSENDYQHLVGKL